MPKQLDLIGKKFGFLTVIKKSNIKKHKLTQWECMCDCGNHTIEIGCHIAKGIKKSCGCKLGKKFENSKFGYLKVLELQKNTRGNWKCLCDCGNITYVNRGHLCSGNIFSCGCSHKRKNRTESTWREIYYHHFKKNSSVRKIEFNLNIEEVKNICVKPCFYCGLEHSFSKKDRYYDENKIEIFFNGLDRIDSNKPYCLENVVPCCNKCNLAKSTMTIKEFIFWIINVYMFYIEKNNNNNKITKTKEEENVLFYNRYDCIWKTINSKFKHAAKSRKINFEITLEDIKNICSKPCFYCNVSYCHNKKDSFFKENNIELFFNGLDRIDSNEGYKINNIVPCCRKCNLAKHTMTQEEFKNWINKIYNFFIKTKAK